MPVKLLLTMSLRNLWRHGRKSLGTFIVMTVSVLALCLLSGYTQSNVELIRDAFMRWGARGHLVIERPASELARRVEGAGQLPLTAEIQRRIEAVLDEEPQLQTHARVLRISGMVSNAKVSTIFAGIGQDVEAIRAIKGPAYEYDVVAGTPLWMETRPQPLVLGQGLAAILGCDVPDVGFAPLQPGDTPQSRPLECPPGALELTATTRGTARVNAVRAQPTGIMDWGIKEINDRLVVMPMDDAQTLLNTTDVSEYHLLLKDGSDEAAARARIATALAEAGLEDVAVFLWSDRAAFYQQVKAVLGGFLNFIALIACAIGFTSLLNASHMNFIQRSREFATLRSLGFTRRFVLALTALENSWLALGAALAGIGATAAIVWTVREAQIMWTPPGSSNAVPIDLAWVLPTYVAALMGVVLLAVIASAIPTHKIMRRPIRAVLSDA
ncbi:ABC transporter permease [Microbulbifer thermotolerans]|nr:FtsX-like permease family protein [Microbulbifer thermotolerans]MCX2778278.1 FtsX-like permease family protein [Microbulbifer thermotolerans]MCX2804317.1 FtsX-like permease family protein [Microbulbifer thermotolerans]MCX2832122.1 FtsX-like permease family protein [Microbulbifer thermotolerans]MCX2834010.1 FtsX-like permease family protein [Microbulbifer thermotolerans]